MWITQFGLTWFYIVFGMTILSMCLQMIQENVEGGVKKLMSKTTGKKRDNRDKTEDESSFSTSDSGNSDIEQVAFSARRRLEERYPPGPGNWSSMPPYPMFMMPPTMQPPNIMMTPGIGEPLAFHPSDDVPLPELPSSVQDIPPDTITPPPEEPQLQPDQNFHPLLGPLPPIVPTSAVTRKRSAAASASDRLRANIDADQLVTESRKSSAFLYRPPASAVSRKSAMLRSEQFDGT